MEGAKMQLEDCKISPPPITREQLEMVIRHTDSPSLSLGLDDLCVRFIINLPQEDLQSVPRICFQVEEAQWFYEDFIRPLDPSLPTMSLRSFCLRIFQHCPLLTTFPVGAHIQAFEEFLAYKVRIPVRGAILLNEDMDSVVLVRGWKKNSSWSFPRGKINKDEDDLDCAIREVYEETGLDVWEAGLVSSKEAVKFIEVTMRDQQIRLYVFRNVPIATKFEPKTRKEISDIQWYKLSELPAFRKKGNQTQNENANNAKNANKFYMVAPFLVPLKKWVVQQRKKDTKVKQQYLAPEPVPEETATEDDIWIPKVESQSQPTAGGVPDQDILAGATMELKRLLSIQPPTHGLQPHLVPNEAPQDKGGALLALLQSKGPTKAAPGPETLVPQTPLDHTIPTAQQPPTPHHHPAQHPPLASHKQPPPHFPIPPDAQATVQDDQWLAFQTQTQTISLTASHPHLFNTVKPSHNAPPLVHPQPLPPQVQKTGVFNYTTPPPNVFNVQPAQGAFPMMYPGQQPQPNQGRQYGAPLTNHSKALLNAFKSGPPGSDMSSASINQPSQSNPAIIHQQPTRQPHVVPDAAAASQPYQPGSNPAMPPSMYPSNNLNMRSQGPVNQKHRSALLGMFKTADSNRTPQVAPIPTSVQPQNLAGPPSDTAPQVPLASLSLTGPSTAGSSSTYQTPPRNARENAMTLASNAGTHHPGQPALLGLLARNQSDGQPSEHGVALSSILAPYSENPHAMPSSLASPPGASKLPMPNMALRGRTELPPEHKQKLLSLFGKPQPPPATRGVSDILGKGKEVYRVGSGEPGARHTPPTNNGLGSRRNSQTPISPADRNFLLEFLQSAGQQG